MSCYSKVIYVSCSRMQYHTYFIFLSFGYYHVLDINCDYGIIIGVYYSNPVYTELFVLPMQQCLLHCIKSGLCSSCKESRT